MLVLVVLPVLMVVVVLFLLLNTAVVVVDAPETNNKWWCWCFWSLELPVLLLMQCKELRCRAWDESSNVQPANLTWNLMYAQPFRIPSRPCLVLCRESLSLSCLCVCLLFEHERRVG